MKSLKNILKLGAVFFFFGVGGVWASQYFYEIQQETIQTYKHICQSTTHNDPTFRSFKPDVPLQYRYDDDKGQDAFIHDIHDEESTEGTFGLTTESSQKGKWACKHNKGYFMCSSHLVFYPLYKIRCHYHSSKQK